MPSEPEHPMERPLRAYARQRRTEAGAPALHPANRRLLQAEVARLRQARQPGAPPAWRRFPWIRLALAAAACAVLAFPLLRMHLRSTPDRRAADKPLALLTPREPSRPPEAGPVPAPAPPVTPTPPPATPAPAAAIQPGPAAAPALRSAPPPLAADAPVAAASAPAAPAVTEQTRPRLLAQGAPTARLAAPPAPQRQRYQRTDSPGDPAALLQAFDLEQTGSAVRLLDTDGSVYSGQVSPTNRQRFVVSGLHKASGRTVTVEGSFAAAVAAAGDATPTGPNSRAARPAPAMSPAGSRAADSTLQLRIRPEAGEETRATARPLAR